MTSSDVLKAKMKRRLENMTLEELWQLFPIVLEPHNEQWALWAHEEIALLSTLLAPFCPRLNHIGSTAIPGIMAKPIIDILMETAPEADWQQIKDRLTAAGYICMAESAERLSFNKGYTPDGYAQRVFHIHLHRRGDNAELAFRDYLIAHPEVASEYEQLKQSLLPAYRHDRDGYTEAKTGFVARVLRLAAE